MLLSRFVISFVALLMLSGCTSKMNPDGTTSKTDFGHWVAGEDSEFAQDYWKAPTGYTGQNNHAVNSADGTVTVYPVEGDLVVTEQVTQYEEFLPPVEDSTYIQKPMDNYGRLAEQVFYKHGSSRLSGSEKMSLQSVGREMGADDIVTVVGHASHRVDGVTDPDRRSNVNYQMADKRAKRVGEELRKAGVSPSAIQTVSKGDAEPNLNPAGKSQEAADRRVEVFVSGASVYPSN